MRKFVGTVFFLVLLQCSVMVPQAMGRTVRIAVAQSMPPYVIPERNSGLELDIVREAMALAGHTVEPTYVPYARVCLMLHQHAVDAALTVSPRLIHTGYFLSESHIAYHNVAITRTEDALAIQSVKGLEGKTVTAFPKARSRLGVAFCESMERCQRYRETDNQRTQLTLLFSGKVQVIIMDRYIFENLRLEALKRSDIDANQKVTIHDIFPPIHYHVAFTDPQLCRKFDAGLRKLRKSGRYAMIEEQYHHWRTVP